MKKYTIEITNDGGKLSMKRLNDGFNTFELLGFLKKIINDEGQEIDAANLSH